MLLSSLGGIPSRARIMDRYRRIGTASHGMGWDGMGWDGMGWDGMGWDGMGWDGMDGTHWNTSVERDTVRAQFFAQEHNTTSLARVRVRTTPSVVQWTNPTKGHRTSHARNLGRCENKVPRNPALKRIRIHHFCDTEAEHLELSCEAS